MTNPVPVLNITPGNTIICAAVKQDGIVYLGARHGFAIQAAIAKGCKQIRADEYGFVDGDGNYLTREEASERVFATGQYRRYTGGAETLYSEDLW